MKRRNPCFKDLFKKFRLRSEFKTLSEFADFLSLRGYIYEDSLFSHWQQGERIPKDRNLLLTLISLFIERKGITTLDEMDEFLASANQGYLTKYERLKYANSCISTEKDLTHFERELVHSCGAFKGWDISFYALAWIHEASNLKIKKACDSLCLNGYFSQNTTTRFALTQKGKDVKSCHPEIWFKKALSYYQNNIECIIGSEQDMQHLLSEVENIKSVILYNATSIPAQVEKLLKLFNSLLWEFHLFDEIIDLNTKLLKSRAPTIRILSYIMLGRMNYWEGQFKAAHEKINGASRELDVYYSSQLAVLIYDYRGRICIGQGNYIEALSFCQKSLELLQSEYDFEDKGNIYRHIAQVYFLKKAYKTARVYLIKALQEYELIHSTYLRSVRIDLINHQFFFLNMKEKKFKEARLLQGEEINFPSSTFYLWHNLALGLVEQNENRFTEARIYFNKSKHYIHAYNVKPHALKLSYAFSLLENEAKLFRMLFQK